MLLTAPVLLWAHSQRSLYFRSILKVLTGKQSWVGYSLGNLEHLPELKKGILTTASLFPENMTSKKADELNMIYAKNYRLINDVEILYRAWQKIGKHE